MKKLTAISILCFMVINTAVAKLEIGDAAPDFTLDDVQTGEGIRLSDFRGQVVVLQMWKICAGNCRGVVELLQRIQSELLVSLYPNLPEIQADHGPLLKVLSVNVINKPKRILAKLKEDKIDYQVLRGRDSGIAREYQLVTLPMVFVINKDGNISYMSAFPEYDELEEVIGLLLKEITG